MTIRIGKDVYLPKVQIIRYKSAVIRQGIAALLYSTNIFPFQVFLTPISIILHRDLSIGKWIIPFFVGRNMPLPLYSGRSPPFQSGFSVKKSDWRNKNGG
jgi:hypothetical protein